MRRASRGRACHGIPHGWLAKARGCREGRVSLRWTGATEAAAQQEEVHRQRVEAAEALEKALAASAPPVWPEVEPILKETRRELSIRGMTQGRGKLVMANGDTYEGEFKAGRMDGYGRMQYSDGDSYEGVTQESVTRLLGDATATTFDYLLTTFGPPSDRLPEG